MTHDLDPILSFWQHLQESDSNSQVPQIHLIQGRNNLSDNPDNFLMLAAEISLGYFVSPDVERSEMNMFRVFTWFILQIVIEGKIVLDKDTVVSLM